MTTTTKYQVGDTLTISLQSDIHRTPRRIIELTDDGYAITVPAPTQEWEDEILDEIADGHDPDMLLGWFLDHLDFIGSEVEEGRTTRVIVDNPEASARWHAMF